MRNELRTLRLPTELFILAVCTFPFITRTLAESLLGIKFDKDGIELLNQQVAELQKQGVTK